MPPRGPPPGDLMQSPIWLRCQWMLCGTEPLAYEADRLADQGRLSHPRCPCSGPRHVFSPWPLHPPSTKRQRKDTASELDSVVQVLNFSPYKDSKGGSVA